jgi:hypothetical protein
MPAKSCWRKYWTAERPRTLHPLERDRKLDAAGNRQPRDTRGSSGHDQDLQWWDHGSGVPPAAAGASDSVVIVTSLSHCKDSRILPFGCHCQHDPAVRVLVISHPSPGSFPSFQSSGSCETSYQQTTATPLLVSPTVSQRLWELAGSSVGCVGRSLEKAAVTESLGVSRRASYGARQLPDRQLTSLRFLSPSMALFSPKFRHAVIAHSGLPVPWHGIWLSVAGIGGHLHGTASQREARRARGGSVLRFDR